MYTLYYIPGTCSMAVHVLLNELGEKVKLENVSDPSGGSKRPPEFLKINPRGNVPVLVDEGFAIREGAAIMMYLMEKHQSPLLPASGKERAQALEWLMFCNATLHPAYGKAFSFKKTFSGELLEKATASAVEAINKLWREVDERLASSPYLAGKDLTMADVLLTVISNWSPNISSQIQIGPNAKKLFKNVIARPSWQKAVGEEKVEYKIAV